MQRNSLIEYYLHLYNSLEMQDEEILSSIKQVISELIKNKATPVTPESKIIEDLGLESIDFIDLIFELERKFKVEIDLNLLGLELAKYKERRFTEVRIVDLKDFVKKSIAG